MFCIQCGIASPDGARFCPQCDDAVTASEKLTSAPSSPPAPGGTSKPVPHDVDKKQSHNAQQFARHPEAIREGGDAGRAKATLKGVKGWLLVLCKRWSRTK
jgi:hypothetical protein